MANRKIDSRELARRVLVFYRHQIKRSRSQLTQINASGADKRERSEAFKALNRRRAKLQRKAFEVHSDLYARGITAVPPRVRRRSVTGRMVWAAA